MKNDEDFKLGISLKMSEFCEAHQVKITLVVIGLCLFSLVFSCSKNNVNDNQLEINELKGKVASLSKEIEELKNSSQEYNRTVDDRLHLLENKISIVDYNEWEKNLESFSEVLKRKNEEIKKLRAKINKKSLGKD